MSTKQCWIGTGRRKRGIARVRMVGGTGKITINNTPIEEYFPNAMLIMDLKQPLTITDNENRFDITINVNGGGYSGQAGAARLGIARALLSFDANTDQTREDSYRKVLKVNGLITRDSRVKERKKYGLKKARRAPQFSKR